MKVHVNCMFKNEATLLEKVLPFWQEYDVDRFVFFDDHSTDGTRDVVFDYLGDDAQVIISTLEQYSEGGQRSIMFEESRRAGADIVISLDADELLSHSMVHNFRHVMDIASRSHLFTKQYNVVGSLNGVRNDPEYLYNCRDFILPVKYSGEYDLTASRYHTPRMPPLRKPLPQYMSSQYGFIHLQAINPRFYALKQLWYKTFEYVEYGKSVEEINAAYDPVVNGLDFRVGKTPKQIVGDWEFDMTVFDRIAKERDYLGYIQENMVDGLITFGREYLE